MFISLHRHHFAMSNYASATPNLQRPLNQKLAETIIQKTAQLLAAELFTARPRHIRGCCFCTRWDGLSSPTSKKEISVHFQIWKNLKWNWRYKIFPSCLNQGGINLGNNVTSRARTLWAYERLREPEPRKKARMSQTDSEWAGWARVKEWAQERSEWARETQSEPERVWFRLKSTLLTAHHAR